MRREGVEDRGSEELTRGEEQPTDLRSYSNTEDMGHGPWGTGQGPGGEVSIDGSQWWLWWVNSVVGLGDRYVLRTQYTGDQYHLKVWNAMYRTCSADLVSPLMCNQKCAYLGRSLKWCRIKRW